MKNDFEINADHWKSCFLHMHFYVICLADGRRVWTKFVCLWNTNVLKNNKTVFWYNKKAGQGKSASPGEECYSTECIYMHITIKYCSLIQYLKLRQALNLPSIYIKKKHIHKSSLLHFVPFTQRTEQLTFQNPFIQSNFSIMRGILSWLIKSTSLRESLSNEIVFKIVLKLFQVFWAIRLQCTTPGPKKNKCLKTS